MSQHTALETEAKPELFYSWDNPEQPLAVRLSLGLIERLSLEVTEAFKAVPKRGLEIGGILLGRVEGGRPTVVIEDYELLESEHLHGPSYLFSAADRAALERSLARWRDLPEGELRAVGFFRSHTRQVLAFDEQDAAVASEIFHDPRGVFLLIKPTAGAASLGEIGIWKDGLLQPVAEFPFQKNALREGGFEILTSALSPEAEWRRSVQHQIQPADSRFAPPPIPDGSRKGRGGYKAPEAANGTENGDLRSAVSERNFRPGHSRAGALWRRLFWILPLAASLILGILLWRRAQPPHVEPVANVPSAQQGNNISLNVQHERGAVILSWNHTSPVVQQADHGVVAITDGGKLQRLRLNRRELANGRVSYVPKSNDVSFELQVFAPAHSVIESIRSFAEPQPPAAAAPVNAQNARKGLKRQAGASNRLTPGEARIIIEPPAEIPTPPAAVASGSAASPPAPAPETPELSKQADTRESVERPEPPPKPAPESKPRLRAPVSTVSVEAAGPSRVRRVAERISPTRWVRRHSGNDRPVPPRAVRQTKPKVSSQLLRDMPEEELVDIKAWIDSAGEVVKTELLSNREKGPLADAAIAAAWQWVFEPARIGDRAVDGQVILHFRFQNPDATR